MATQYGRYRITVLNSQGQPIVGATVTLRKQGATVNGLHSGVQTVFTVNDPGAIIDTDSETVKVGTGATERTVLGVTATQITVSGAGFNDVPDDARLTVTNTLPTLYEDAQGAETKTNPLTTNASGMVEAWLEIQPIDVHITGGTDPNGQPAPETLYTDEMVGGTGRVVFYDFNGTAVAQRWQAKRAFATTDKYLSVLNSDSTEEFYFAGGGGQFKLGAAGSTASCQINGNVNATGAWAFAGNITHSSGSLTLQALSIASTYLAANSVHPATTVITGSATDIAITTTETTITSMTTTYTPTSGNVGVQVTVNVPVDVDATGSSGAAMIRLYINGVLKASGIYGVQGGAANRSIGTVSFTHEEAAPAASGVTYEVKAQKVTFAGANTATILYAGAAAYAGKMIIREFKK